MKKWDYSILDVMMLSKKVLVEIFKNTKYFTFIEEYRKERNLSFTACIRQLLFQKIDELERDKLVLQQSSPVAVEIQIEEPKKKKDMLKNLKRLKD